MGAEKKPPNAQRPPHRIPPDREDGGSSWVHLALIGAGRLGEISPWLLMPLWAGLIYASGWMWPARRWIAVATAVFFLLLDWGMLALLPVTSRSWGPVTPPLLGLALVRALLYGSGLFLRSTPVGFPLILIVQSALSGIAIYATWIEPFRVRTTRLTHPLPNWHSRKPLRILHLSDVHFEGPTPREAQILEAAEALEPDMIVLTGDYLNLSSVYDPQAHAGTRRFLQQLHAPLGVYAITGSPPVDVPGIVPEVLQSPPIQWLDDEAVEIRVGDQTLWLMGVRTTYRFERDLNAVRVLTAQAPADSVRILLYHTPDLMPEVRDEPIDLYLCGHTHGGQIRLPLFGAVATSSRWGKRYEQGLYRENGTALYISRGLGVEGLGAPRARFLAPPEIILWTLTQP